MYRYCALVIDRVPFECLQRTGNMSTANKQRREISHLEYVFISRQVRGNRLLIHGELYQRTLKQDVLKQRPSSLASKNICVDCLAIVRLKLTDNRRPKHSLWLNKRYIWNSKTKIVNRSTQQRYRKFYRQNKSLSTVVQLSRPCWTDRITCLRKLDNIVWSDAYVIHELKIGFVALDPPRDSVKLCILLKLSFVLATCFSDIKIVHKVRSERF